VTKDSATHSSINLLVLLVVCSGPIISRIKCDTLKGCRDEDWLS
jgi:hypothetical protein